MRADQILSCCETRCVDVADGIDGHCLKHSRHLPGFEQLREDRAELCSCGSHLGYWNPWGFAVTDYATMAIKSLTDAGNGVAVTCDDCERITDIQVSDDALIEMPRPEISSDVAV